MNQVWGLIQYTINGNIQILLFNATNSVTFNKDVGVQIFRSVFKIYVSDDSARFGLIKNGLSIENNYVRIHDGSHIAKTTTHLK